MGPFNGRRLGAVLKNYRVALHAKQAMEYTFAVISSKHN